MTDLTHAAALALWLGESENIVAFTGAGISTESGIPDFRSPGGVWSRYRTVYFDEFCESAEARYEYWRQKCEAHTEFAAAEPNIAHRALADWEANGRLHGVITQNIDGLHQEAGSRNVLELHGTAREVACLDCDWRDRVDPWVASFLEHDKVPECPACVERERRLPGRLKHATVSFGQSLPSDVMYKASQWVTDCDLCIVLGSSLVVEPAASLPRLARERGARLVIVNRDPTPLDQIANLVINEPLGEVFGLLAGL